MNLILSSCRGLFNRKFCKYTHKVIKLVSIASDTVRGGCHDEILIAISTPAGNASCATRQSSQPGD